MARSCTCTRYEHLDHLKKGYQPTVCGNSPCGSFKVTVRIPNKQGRSQGTKNRGKRPTFTNSEPRYLTVWLQSIRFFWQRVHYLVGLWCQQQSLTAGDQVRTVTSKKRVTQWFSTKNLDAVNIPMGRKHFIKIALFYFRRTLIEEVSF